MTRTRPRSSFREPRIGSVEGGGLLLVLGLVLLSATPVVAAEIPTASAFSIQTNGPIAAIGLGDWYTATAGGGGAGYHYLEITIPCGWPSGTPVHVDLFSPETNQVSGALGVSEEPNGNYDSTQFELYAPGTVIGPGFASPMPGTGIAGSQRTFQPGGLGAPEQWVRYFTIAPASCGTYVLRSEVLADPPGEGNDQNGWRLRVGSDDDGDPDTAPPANTDDADGVPGTNDEIVIGVTQASYQHDAGGTQCFTLLEHVAPGQPSVTFHNFDLGGLVRVRYYAPSDAYDPAGTSNGTAGVVSGAAQWNGSANTTRVGDTIANPEPGWWRIVTCTDDHDQFVQEGALARPAYFEQPPTPALQISKTDGLTNVAPGQTVTYQILVANVSTGASAGAATQVVVTDTLPAGVTFVSCSARAPAQGTWSCAQAAGVVTFTQSGWISAGSTATLELAVRVNQGAVAPLVNLAQVAYRDALGNPYPTTSASDSDGIATSADLSITKTDSPDPVQVGQALTYILTVRNDGPTDATAVSVTDTLPAGVTFDSATASQGTCSQAAATVTCALGNLATGAQASATIVVTPTAAGSITNAASVSATQADPDSADNTDSEGTEVSAANADLSVTKTADPSRKVEEGDLVTYTIVVRNDGPAVADDVVVQEDPPAGLSLQGHEASVGTYDPDSGSWTVGDLAAGTEEQLELSFRVEEGTAGDELVNEVTVEAGDAVDPTPVDASDSATVTVLAAGAGDPDDPEDPDDPADPDDPTDPDALSVAAEATATTGADPRRLTALAVTLAVIGLALLILPARAERRRREPLTRWG